MLGNESQGVSDTAVQLADHTAVIPMAGFVESFNISVAAALILYEAQQQRIRRLGRSGDLTERQKQQLLASFLLRGVVSGNRLRHNGAYHAVVESAGALASASAV